MAAVTETAAVFGTTSALVGVITDPGTTDRHAGPVAVILLNAGLLHRVGPNRIYVELARCLAAAGLTTLRFDFSGIGDSDVRKDALPFEKSVIGEVKDAMDLLGRLRGAHRFILMGLCAGAVSAFNTASADPRVVGTVLINPQGYDEDVASLADARRYWRKVFRVFRDPRRWLATIPRNASYRTMVGQLRRLLSPAPSAEDLRGEFLGLIERGVQMLILFSSEHQRGVDELETILGGRLGQLRASGRLEIETIGQATHTFDELRHQAQLLEAIATWTARTFPPARQRATA
jgi:pimeloyl-ACP methyl ester carboxylesterase